MRSCRDLSRDASLGIRTLPVVDRERGLYQYTKVYTTNTNSSLRVASTRYSYGAVLLIWRSYFVRSIFEQPPRPYMIIRTRYLLTESQTTTTYNSNDDDSGVCCCLLQPAHHHYRDILLSHSCCRGSRMRHNISAAHCAPVILWYQTIQQDLLAVKAICSDNIKAVHKRSMQAVQRCSRATSEMWGFRSKFFTDLS